MSSDLQFRIRKARVQFHHWLNNQQGDGDPSKNPLLITRRLKHIPLISLRNAEYFELLNETPKPSEPSSPEVSRNPNIPKVSIPPLPVVHYKPIIRKTNSPPRRQRLLPEMLDIIDEHETIHLHVVDRTDPPPPTSAPPPNKYSDPYQQHYHNYQGVHSSRQQELDEWNDHQKQLMNHRNGSPDRLPPQLPARNPPQNKELISKRYLVSQESSNINENNKTKDIAPNEEDNPFIEHASPDLSDNQLFVYYQHDNDENELKPSNFGMFSNFKGLKNWIMGAKSSTADSESFSTEKMKDIPIDERNCEMSTLKVKRDEVNGHSTPTLQYENLSILEQEFQQEQQQLLAKSPINVAEFFGTADDNKQSGHNNKVTFLHYNTRNKQEEEYEDPESTLPFDLSWKTHLHFAAERIFSDITNNQSTYASNRKNTKGTGGGINFFRRVLSSSTQFAGQQLLRPSTKDSFNDTNTGYHKAGGKPIGAKTKKKIFKNPMNRVALSAARMADGLEGLDINKDKVDAGFRNFNDYSKLQYRYNNHLPENHGTINTGDRNIRIIKKQPNIKKQVHYNECATNINPIQVVGKPSDTGTVIINSGNACEDNDEKVFKLSDAKDETTGDYGNDNLFEGFDGYYTIGFENDIISTYQQELSRDN